MLQRLAEVAGYRQGRATRAPSRERAQPVGRFAPKLARWKRAEQTGGRYWPPRLGVMPEVD